MHATRHRLLVSALCGDGCTGHTGWPRVYEAVGLVRQANGTRREVREADLQLGGAALKWYTLFDRASVDGRVVDLLGRPLVVRGRPSRTARAVGSIPRRLGLLRGAALFITAAEERRVGKDVWLRLAHPFLFNRDEAWVMESRDDGHRVYLRALCQSDPPKVSVDLTKVRGKRRAPPAAGC